MVKVEWGTKRACQACGALFYDLQSDPIVCPKCDAKFDPEAILKSRRNRMPVAEAEEAKIEDDAEEVAEEDDITGVVLDDDEVLPEVDDDSASVVDNEGDSLISEDASDGDGEELIDT